MNNLQTTERMFIGLGWRDLLEKLALLCHTSIGQEKARSLPLLLSREAIQEDLNFVSEAKLLHARGEPLPFGNIGDVRDSLKRLEKEGVLEGSSLIQMAQTLQAGARLLRFLRDRREDADKLYRLASGISPLDDVSSAILDSFEEGGVLSNNASEDLGRLRQKLTELHDTLNKRMRALMETPSITKYLQDHFYTQREDRYVLPIRTDAGSSVEGIVHGSSASGATMFIEPKEVVGLNNQLKVAEMEVAREETRILMELSAMLADEREAIHKNSELLERLDVINARARLSIQLEGYPSTISSSGRLNLQAIRHPLMVLSGAKVIANDLYLEPGHALIITGPNAGGKTVCLKTLGLCALMLRAGMHIPAGPDSEIPLYEPVLAEMGDDQSIEKNLSTFTAHLQHLNQFLLAARPGVLILLDEIAIGTDPGEGAALAQALLEEMTHQGAQVVVTTHYERLKTLPHLDTRFTNASVGFDLERMLPTYRLNLGIPGSSGALAVARRLGVSAKLIERAGSLLDRGAQDLAALMTALAGERTQLEQERLALVKATSSAEAVKREQEKVLEELKVKARKTVQGEFNKSLEELKDARKELELVRALLKRPPTKERVEQADRQISHAAEAIRRHEPHEELQGQPINQSDLAPGMQVLIPKLGGIGEVIENHMRGKVIVRVGGIKTQVAVGDILWPSAQASSKSLKPSTSSIDNKRDRSREGISPRTNRNISSGAEEITQKSESLSRQGMSYDSAGRRTTPFRTDDITLDVRGFRVDDAIAEVEKFIDRALRQGDGVIFVIHGHGTGALKSALRTHLSDNTLIEYIQPASPKDGGDGVTVAWLKD